MSGNVNRGLNVARANGLSSAADDALLLDVLRLIWSMSEKPAYKNSVLKAQYL